MPNFLIPGSAEILLRKTSGPARDKNSIAMAMSQLVRRLPGDLRLLPMTDCLE